MWLISQYTNKRLKEEGRESERLVWQGFLCQRCVHINANLSIHFKANSSTKLWPHIAYILYEPPFWLQTHSHFYWEIFSFHKFNNIAQYSLCTQILLPSWQIPCNKIFENTGGKKCKSVTSHLWGRYDLKLTLSYQWCKNQSPDNVIFLALCSQHADDD